MCVEYVVKNNNVINKYYFVGIDIEVNQLRIIGI